METVGVKRLIKMMMMIDNRWR